MGEKMKRKAGTDAPDLSGLSWAPSTCPPFSPFFGKLKRHAGMDASDTGVTADPMLRVIKRLPELDTSDTGVASDPRIHLGFGKTKSHGGAFACDTGGASNPHEGAFASATGVASNPHSGMFASDTGVASDPSILPIFGEINRQPGMDASDSGVASDPRILPAIPPSCGRKKETNEEPSAALQSFNHPKSSAFTPSTLRKADGVTHSRKSPGFPAKSGKSVMDLTEEELDTFFGPKNTLTHEEYAAIHRENSLKYAKVALKAFNNANGVDYELVDAGCNRYFQSVVSGFLGKWYHINFKARPKSSCSSDNCVQLFFAEIHLFLGEVVVNLCVRLDLAKAISGDCLCWRARDKTCKYCGTRILHPSNGLVEAGYHLIAALVERIESLRQVSDPFGCPD